MKRFISGILIFLTLSSPLHSLNSVSEENVVRLMMLARKLYDYRDDPQMQNKIIVEMAHRIGISPEKLVKALNVIGKRSPVYHLSGGSMDDLPDSTPSSGASEPSFLTANFKWIAACMVVLYLIYQVKVWAHEKHVAKHAPQIADDMQEIHSDIRLLKRVQAEFVRQLMAQSRRSNAMLREHLSHNKDVMRDVEQTEQLLEALHKQVDPKYKPPKPKKRWWRKDEYNPRYNDIKLGKYYKEQDRLEAELALLLEQE